MSDRWQTLLHEAEVQREQLAWLDPWVDRARWCERHRQPLYVTTIEGERIVANYKANVADDLACGRIDPDDPRAEMAKNLSIEGSQLAGVTVMVDEVRAVRQRQVYESGERAIPCTGGPLDGEVAIDVGPHLIAEGWGGGYYGIVKDGDRGVGWLWHPAGTSEGGGT